MKSTRRVLAFVCGLVTLPIIGPLVIVGHVVGALWDWDSDWTKSWAFRLGNEWLDQLRRVRG